MQSSKKHTTYSKFLTSEIPQYEKPYFDKEGQEYFIDRLGVLTYKNKIISDDYLKSKYGKVNLDLYCPAFSTHFVYKGAINTSKMQAQTKSVPISITLRHDFVLGFPLKINMKLSDRTLQVKLLAEKLKKNTEIEKIFWNGEDILNFNGTLQQFILEKDLFISDDTEKYHLDFDCEIRLNEFTPIDKEADKYKYFFSSFNIDEDDLLKRLKFTLKQEDTDFETYLGFGTFDKTRGVCSYTYDEAIEQIKYLLYLDGVKQPEINRLTFQKLYISEKNKSKYAILIGVRNLKNSKQTIKLQDNNSDNDTSFTTAASFD